MCARVILLLWVVLQAGCSSPPAANQPAKPQPVPAGKPSRPTQPEPVPDASFAGTVILANPAARTVVLSCPIGRVPPLGTRLALYREGLKVGEIKVTGPRMDFNIVADVVEGEARVQDTARED